MSGLARRALELVRDELWPYLFFPILFVISRLAFDDAFELREAPHVLRDTTVAIACVGGPAHLTFHLAYERIRRLRPWLQLALGAGIVVASVLLGTELAIALLSPLHGTADYAGEFGRRRFWLPAFLGVGFVSAVLFALSRFRDRVREVELRELRAQKESLAAQIQALQARIQPHFLFNCLNTVASLIEEDPKRAEAAVEKLSDLYRHTLAASQRRLVPLREEIAAVEGFLELEALRYGERLRFRMDVGSGLGDVPVPPLVLQPLVENAVLHGITQRREGGRIEVGVERAGDRIVLRVEDDGPGEAGSGSRHAGSGTALRDLAQRLHLVYAGDATLERGASPLGGWRVRVSIPVEPPEGA
jgi:two-component system sensor histidine kinase AlgZ